MQNLQVNEPLLVEGDGTEESDSSSTHAEDDNSRDVDSRDQALLDEPAPQELGMISLQVYCTIRVRLK